MEDGPDEYSGGETLISEVCRVKRRWVWRGRHILASERARRLALRLSARRIDVLPGVKYSRPVDARELSQPRVFEDPPNMEAHA